MSMVPVRAARVACVPVIRSSLSLAVLHRGLAGPVVALVWPRSGDPGGRDLVDHLGDRGSADSPRRCRSCRRPSGTYRASKISSSSALVNELVVGDQDAVRSKTGRW